MVKNGQLIAILACGFASFSCDAGSFLFAGDADGVNVIAHPLGFDGSGGTLSVSVCADPAGVPPGVGEAAFGANVDLIVQTWNAAIPALDNLGLGAANELSATEVDLRSALLHEMGHCLGLAHPNGGSEAGLSGDAANASRATVGFNLAFDVDPGVDGIYGSADDLRTDDAGLYWYDQLNNDPLSLPAIVDASTLSRDGGLPAGQLFAANGDRNVLAALGVANTEAVMNELQFFDEVQRRLTAEDVRALRLARSGLDRTQGTADDYNVVLSYVGLTDSCNIPVRFDPISEFAQCEISGNFVSGDAIAITAAEILISPNINWYAGLGPNVSMALSDGPDPSVPGEPVLVDVSVTKLSMVGPAGEAAGTVLVDDGAGAQCQAAISNGIGSCTLVPLVRGTRDLVAIFAGSGGFDSVSALTPHTTDGPAVTSISLASSMPTSTVIGQSYMVSATVSSPLGPATGSVSITDDLAENCSAALTPAAGTDASASCALNSVEVGTRDVQVDYTGNADFAAVQTQFAHQIDVASTAIQITDDSPDPSMPGTTVTVSIELNVVAPGAGSPTGTVRVDAGATEFCNIVLPATSCDLVLTSLGARTLSADYPGDGRFAPAQDSEDHLVVGEDVFSDGFEDP